MRALWLSTYALWGILVFCYRIHLHGTLLPFHYFSLSNVAFAVFFGYAVMFLLRRLRLPDLGWRAVGVGLLGVAAIHMLTFWTVVDSRRRDVALYEPNREILRLIAGLTPEQRLGCINCVRQERGPNKGFAKFTRLSSVGQKSWTRPEVESRLGNEFASILVTVKLLPVRSFVLWPADEACCHTASRLRCQRSNRESHESNLTRDHSIFRSS